MTRARTTVSVAKDATAACDATWCVVQTLTSTGDSQIELTRPDGTDIRHIGDTSTNLVATDVTLLDRFMAVAESVDGQQGPTVVERLSLYDIAKRRTVLVTPAATAAYARGSYLWWSTGDNETLTWNGLNLAALR